MNDTITEKILDVLQQILNDKLGAVSVNINNKDQIMIKMAVSDSFTIQDMQRIQKWYDTIR